ncbi:MAG: hypothetical protein Q4D38_14605, partial [Planctomycetia bacterium]|nr:hypothetical protein [Planctomycetia bacterium]
TSDETSDERAVVALFTTRSAETNFGILAENFDFFADSPEAVSVDGSSTTEVAAAGIAHLEPGYNWCLPAGAVVEFSHRKILNAFVPELVGTLSVSVTIASDTPAQSVVLSGASFRGGSTLEAHPAPCLPVGATFEAGESVMVRWNHAAGKWFFFANKTGESVETAVVDAAGTALEGMGTHSDGRTIWATQLSAGSDPVESLATVAVKKTVGCVGTENDEEIWVPFETITDIAENVVWRRGDYYHNGKEIRRVDSIGTVYTDGAGNFWRPMFREYNGRDVWFCKSTSEYLFFDGERWQVQSGIGVYLNAGETTIAELGLVEAAAPVWGCTTKYGIYTPQSGTSAEGEIQFGSPRWRGNDVDGNAFVRSIRKESVGDLRVWQYDGTFATGVSGEIYSGIRYLSEAGKWIMGTWKNETAGWYESDNPPAIDSATIFHLATVEKDSFVVNVREEMNALTTAARYVYEKNETEIRVNDSLVARWTADKSADLRFSFEFKTPESITLVEEPKTFTLYEILSRENAGLVEVKYDETDDMFFIGTRGSNEGWWECAGNMFEMEVTFRHGLKETKMCEMQFVDYTGTQEDWIWLITPQITT